MTIHGFGLGASVVGGFSDAHKSAIRNDNAHLASETHNFIFYSSDTKFVFGHFLNLINNL